VSVREREKEKKDRDGVRRLFIGLVCILVVKQATI